MWTYTNHDYINTLNSYFNDTVTAILLRTYLLVGRPWSSKGCCPRNYYILTPRLIEPGGSILHLQRLSNNLYSEPNSAE